MSYCRFENTLRDLLDCLYVFKDGEYIKSQTEVNRAKEMIEEMVEFLNYYGIVHREPDTQKNINELIENATDPSLLGNNEEEDEEE